MKILNKVFIVRKNILTYQKPGYIILHIKQVGIIGNVLKRRVGQGKLTERNPNGERVFERNLAEVHLGTTDRILSVIVNQS
jgi:hypothetical protein